MFKRLIMTALFAAFVSLPAALNSQAPASVCKDGTTSNATGSGACSGHGGVDKAATKAAHTPPAPPPAAANASHGTPVKCADGTMGTSGQGACSHHGGIAHANAAPAAAPNANPPRPAPAPPSAPATGPNVPATAAAVKCADGTFSNATGSGACSHHGGVAHANTAAPASAAPPAAAANTTPGNGDSPNNNPQGAIAQCKDNTYSHAKQHSGACSKHGGVKKWLDGTAN